MDKEMQFRLEKGREHYENHEFDRAEAYLLKVAEVEDRFADVSNMLGVICHNKGQLAVAQGWFERAIRVNPRYTEAALNLAVVLSEQGRYDEARRIHEHIVSAKPDAGREIEPFARGKIANMHADLGRAYAELQLVDKAVTQYREALSLSPDFVDIRTRLGQTLKDAGRLEEALIELERVRKTRPNYVPARISLGVTYYSVGRYPDAQYEWNEVLRIDPENKTAAMYLRMIEQVLAQAEAKDAGIALEVGRPEREASNDTEDELDFSFDGEKSSVMPAPYKGDEKE